MSVATDHTIRVKRYHPTDPRLGRHVLHDSRSRAFAAPEVDPSTLTSIRHKIEIPTLNQGNRGSCTGNSSTSCVAHELWWAVSGQVLSATDADADEEVAVSVYSDATKLDPFEGEYPPTDTGSNGLSVGKVWQNRGVIPGYLHAFTVNAVLTALATQPVIIGIEWREDSYTPDADGRIRITGKVAGGHEILVDELDVENKRVWLHNSWGETWGLDGRGYLTWDDLAELLAADGDCTIFTPAGEPAPTPDPGKPSEVERIRRAIRRFMRLLESVVDDLT